MAAYRKKKDTTDKTDTVLLLRVKGKLWRRKEMVTGVRKAESVNRAKNQGVVTFPKPHKNVREMVDDENFHLTGKGGWSFLT